MRSNLPLNKSPSIIFLSHSVVRAIRTFNVHFETRGFLTSCEMSSVCLFVSCAQFAKISLNFTPHHALQLDNTVVSICCVPVTRPGVVLLHLSSVHQPSSSTLRIFSDVSKHVANVGGAPPRCGVQGQSARLPRRVAVGVWCPGQARIRRPSWDEVADHAHTSCRAWRIQGITSRLPRSHSVPRGSDVLCGALTGLEFVVPRRVGFSYRADGGFQLRHVCARSHGPLLEFASGWLQW